MTRRFGKRWICNFLRCAGFKYRVRIRRDPENDGPQTVGHALGQGPIALDALRNGVRSAPFLHHQHGRDSHEALAISTVVTMTGTISLRRSRQHLVGFRESAPVAAGRQGAHPLELVHHC